MLCDYGCGQQAQYILKNGKHCCSKHYNCCPAIRQKNSQGIRKALETGKIDRKSIYQKLPEETKNRMKWNKGLTKETDERVKRTGETYTKNYRAGKFENPFKNKKHSKKTKQLISQNTSLHYNYDVDRHGGRGKKGWYKNFFCSSTYELAFIIYCLDHNISIIRNTKYYEYEYKGKTHKYYPDFLVNDEFIEIKGYWTNMVDIKIQAVKDKPIKILYYKDLKYVFDYIKQKYNKDVDKNIHELYEKT